MNNPQYDVLDQEPGNRPRGLVKDKDEHLDPVTGMWRKRDARISEMKADAMRMIEEMPDAAFETWYTTAFQAMDEAACAQRDADELAARRFASATMYHEEACW